MPVSMLRAAQFHEFAGQYLAKMPGPIHLGRSGQPPDDLINRVAWFALFCFVVPRGKGRRAAG